jgi:ubiquinone/menaquinone biosynthesis C-methylase UbiE
VTTQTPPFVIDSVLHLLRCPQSGERLIVNGQNLVSDSGAHSYKISDSGIPLFAEEFRSPEAAIQQDHYDQIAEAYAANLQYPHTQEYTDYLDRVLRDAAGADELGACAEVCCGTGEAFALFEQSIETGVGVDISSAMLAKARRSFEDPKLNFVQGDATRLPLSDDGFDTVFMLGGIHHVPDRDALFRQVFRILKPGGIFIWREPLNDFWLWRILRAIVYRLSPMLDHETERPLKYSETVPVLESAGFSEISWRSCGFIGFLLFMNSDVLFVNRLFRFIPGIRAITRSFARFDDWCTRRSYLKRAGLQVVGSARKPTVTHP